MSKAGTVEKSLANVESHRDAITNGQTKIGPGQPLRMTTALNSGPVPDALCQGDLILIVIDNVPENFTRRENGGGKLVPGETLGAKHVIEDTSAVELFDPPNWSATYDELLGPAFRTVKETAIGHPTHGAVVIDAGLTIQCRYQRVLESEEAKERRQRD